MPSSNAHSSLQKQPLSAALIIAGGRGTRFWPESRIGNPKPLFAIDGKTSLLEATILRTAALFPIQQIFVLVPEGQRRRFIRAVRKLLPAVNLIAEPEGRGTAVAIAYGCGVIANRLWISTIVVALPADHRIEPRDAYKVTLLSAISMAHRHQRIVMVGIPPTRAESGYGYMQMGRAVEEGFEVERFVEKPSLKIARKMIRSGNFLWNTGIFVMPIENLAAELERHAPELGQALRQLPRLQRQRRAAIYSGLSFDSFDRTVLESAQGLLGVRAGFDWHDVGSWEGLWDALRGSERNVLIGNAIAVKSEGILARANRRLMVFFEMDDVLAIDTGDVILIARRSRSQKIGTMIGELTNRGLTQYL